MSIVAQDGFQILEDQAHLRHPIQVQKRRLPVDLIQIQKRRSPVDLIQVQKRRSPVEVIRVQSRHFGQEKV